MGLGLTPMILAVVATPFVPALADAGVRQRVGVVLYAALASIVPMTAYAVAVGRVMDLQFVVRTTLHYALARTAIWGVIIGPITYLLADVFWHRDLTIAQYLDHRRPFAVFALSGVGLLALTSRPWLARTVDSWFEREPLDSSRAMARAELGFREATDLRGIANVLQKELEGTLHADYVSVLLVSDDGRSVVAFDGATPPLPSDAVLLELLRVTKTELRFDGRAERVARLLPPADQEWLDRTGTQLVSPLVGATGTLLGLVAVGAPRSGLAYTPQHLALLTAMSGHAAMLLENRWLRQAHDRTALAPPAGRVDWQH
jgi:GAF domain-containing protein